MQNDALRKLTDVFSYPGSFLSKAKKIKKSTTSVSLVHPDKFSISPTSDTRGGSLPIPEVAKSARTTDAENKQCLSVHTATTTTSTTGKVHTPTVTLSTLSAGSVLKSPLKSPFHHTTTGNNSNTHSNSNGSSTKGASPISPGASKIFTKEEPPIVHYPVAVSSLDQFSPQRRVWLQNCLSPSGIASTMGDGVGPAGAGAVTATLNNNVLKTGSAWDTVENHRHHHQVVKPAVAHNNPNEAIGLLFTKCKSPDHPVQIAALLSKFFGSLKKKWNTPFRY
jgi:hypothetical protein